MSCVVSVAETVITRRPAWNLMPRSVRWLNSAETDRNGVPPPVSGVPVPPPEIAVPPPDNDVPSSFGGKSLKLLPPEVRF